MAGAVGESNFYALCLLTDSSLVQVQWPVDRRAGAAGYLLCHDAPGDE